MRILVTGGSGFIGTHLIQKLTEKGNEVVNFDLRPGKNQNIQFIQGDTTSSQEVESAIRNVDAVFHLASVVSVRKTEEDPLKTLNIGIDGTRNVLEACRKNDIKKIIYPSSSEIYGEPLKLPILETDRLNPLSSYAVAKFVSEEFIKIYNKSYGLNYTIFRPFNVYGQNQSNDFVIPKFVSNALSHQPIDVHGNGSQIRAFSFIDDVMEGFSLSLEKGNNEIFNIGNATEPLTIIDLARKVIQITESKSELRFIPFEQTERKNKLETFKRIPDITKIKQMLNYDPKTSLDDGIRKIISHVRGN